MNKINTLTLAALALATPALFSTSAHASDHADTPMIAQNPGLDVSDVFIFPSPTKKNNVVLAMNVHPLIGPGMGNTARFDPRALYQFKIDNNGDFVEDLVITFRPTIDRRGNQHIVVAGPKKPWFTGPYASAFDYSGTMGDLNETIHAPKGVMAFAGPREDPFFFDLEQFFNILPDRATPITGIPVANPNVPQAASFRAPGQAVDFLSAGGFNVLSLVVEVPRQRLLGRLSQPISVWCTSSMRQGFWYSQVDRLARPAVNEVFATVANNRHKINNEAVPTEDMDHLKKDIFGFMKFPAGRSDAIANVMTAVLVPDVMKADLRSMDNASYLGFETGGATGGKFGGRGLTDDVVDISLSAIFGNTIPALGLAPDDGAAIPSLTTDNVGPEGKHFLGSFPYLGNPR